MTQDLAAWLSSALDPVAFCETLGFHPYDYQAQILRSSSRRLCWVAGRQIGKSTTMAARALWTACYSPGSTTVVVATREDASRLLFEKVLGFNRRLGRPLLALQENIQTLVLENESRIVALPASASGIRGYSCQLVIIDEAAFVPDEIFTAVEPMTMVTGGSLLLASSPNGKRGFFYEAARSPQWEKVHVPSTACPAVDQGDLDGMRERLGDLAYRAEVLGEFVDAAGSLLSGPDIDAIFGCAAPAAQPVKDRVVSRPWGRLPHERTRVRRGPAAASEPHPGRSGCGHRWQLQTKADGTPFKVCRLCGREEAP
jgi:hypothetical protein